jgi:hypothetical protein
MNKILKTVRFKLIIASGFVDDQAYDMSLPYRVSGYRVDYQGRVLTIDNRAFDNVKDIEIL